MSVRNGEKKIKKQDVEPSGMLKKLLNIFVQNNLDIYTNYLKIKCQMD